MCEHMKLNGRDIIVCGTSGAKQQFCRQCGRAAIALCDWKMPDKKSGTCDAPMCAQHSKQVMPGKHLCPEHQLHYDRWKKRRSPAQGELPFTTLEAAA